MPPAAGNVLKALRDHLVAEGLVREPRVAGALPPLWLAPQLGVPGPGEGQNATEVGADAVLGAFITGGFAPVPFTGSWQRKPIVELRIRVRDAWRAEDLERAITGVIIDRYGWDMAGLFVLESQQWRALAQVASDDQGFEFLAAYSFELYR